MWPQNCSHSRIFVHYDALTVKRKTSNANSIESAPKLVTLPRAAKQLGVGIRTLKRLIADGKLKTVRVYARDLIAPAELDRFSREGALTDSQSEDSV